MTDRERVRAALAELGERGYETHEDFWCCQTCGLAALKPETTHYAFYHQQDTEAAWPEENEQDDISEDGLALCWGGDGDVIAEVLRDHGLRVEWDGSKGQRITVFHGEEEEE